LNIINYDSNYIIDLHVEALGKSKTVSPDKLFSSLVLHHIGIAVPSIEKGQKLYSAMGFVDTTPIYHDPVQKVRVQFFSTGSNVWIELVEPAADDSPVSNFLKKRGSGFHHLCYLVDDIYHMCEYVREQGGIITCTPVPAVAFNGKFVAFVYWHGTIIEFLEQGGKTQ
jgi:methylmalonyl-CoA/ethylmalonyl-CoA epimerase